MMMIAVRESDLKCFTVVMCMVNLPGSGWNCSLE